MMTVDPAIAMLDPGWLSPAGVSAIGLAGLASLCKCRSHVAGTTLLSAWRWALLSLCALIAADLALMLPSLATSDWVAQVRYAAGITVFAPQVAVLGAKRPQDRAWQFVVLSLLVVLLLPAANSFFRSGGSWTIDSPWRWFLLVLLLVGLANHMATRYWPSCLLVAIGQSIVLAEFLPWPVSILTGAGRVTGLAALVAAGMLVAFQLPRRQRSSEPVDRLWFDFRDLFGSLWSLRIAGRFNASAEMYGWPVRITWHGLASRSHSSLLRKSGATAGLPSSASMSAENTAGQASSGTHSCDESLFQQAAGAAAADHVEPADDSQSNDAGTHEAVRRNLRTLLRRFVSAEWIAQRLSGP